ncbi:MAG TPA: transposase, partial [Phycisphaerae bacterium]|nr:transposase [Phycisphaerae bacterium]
VRHPPKNLESPLAVQLGFTFLDDPSLEAANNRAERALRPAVIARKSSCGNKTLRGKRTWEILTSLAATCYQPGQDSVEYLRPFLALAPASSARQARTPAG